MVTAVFFVGLGFIIQRLVGAVVTDNLLVQTQQLTATFVNKQAHDHLDPELFDHRIRAKEEIVQEHREVDVFFKALKTESVVKIKLWDDQATVIHLHKSFSDEIDFDAINKSYPDNLMYQKAMAGEVNAAIGALTKPENVSEVGFTQLMELYVPVYQPNQDQPIGVAEVYYRLDEFNQRTRSVRGVVAMIVAGTFILLYAILLLVVRNASVTLTRQNKELEESRRKLAQQAQSLETEVIQRTRELNQAKTGLEKQIQARTQELEEAKSSLEKKVAERTGQLEEKLRELEQLNKAMVGRELQMIKLKERLDKTHKHEEKK